jgi:hypothetical protein
MDAGAAAGEPTKEPAALGWPPGPRTFIISAHGELHDIVGARIAAYQRGPLVQCCNALRHPTRSLVNTEHALTRVAQALVQKIHVELAGEATHEPPANVVK